MSFKHNNLNKFVGPIVITTGDQDGVGLEVTCKALAKTGPIKNENFFLFRSKSLTKKQLLNLKKLDTQFVRLTFDSVDAATGFYYMLQQTNSLSPDFIFDLELSMPPALWVEIAALGCLKNVYKALVTGPLSKDGILKAGLKDIGHTGILKRVTKTKNLFMSFVGDHFNLVLATDHIPLSEVEKNLKKENSVAAALNACLKLKALLNDKRPIGFLGLNPHAGEKSILGSFEHKYLNVVSPEAVGPLCPDAAFNKINFKKYSCFLAMYHDQGLIPFKLLHEHRGVHLTLGLPFIRTSVDHGTAKDIFDQGKANPSSMYNAIKLAIKLTNASNIKSTKNLKEVVL